MVGIIVNRRLSSACKWAFDTFPETPGETERESYHRHIPVQQVFEKIFTPRFELPNPTLQKPLTPNGATRSSRSGCPFSGTTRAAHHNIFLSARKSSKNKPNLSENADLCRSLWSNRINLARRAVSEFESQIAISNFGTELQPIFPP